MNISVIKAILMLLEAAVAIPTGSDMSQQTQSGIQSDVGQLLPKMSETGKNQEEIPFNFQEFRSISLDCFGIIRRMGRVLFFDSTQNSIANSQKHPPTIASAIGQEAVISSASPVNTVFKPELSKPVFPPKDSVPDITKMSDNESLNIVNTGKVPSVTSVPELRLLYSILPDSYKQIKSSEPNPRTSVPVSVATAPELPEDSSSLTETFETVMPEPNGFYIFSTVPDTPEVAKAKTEFERAYEQQLMAVLG